MGLFGKKKITVDDLARQLLMQGHSLIKQTTKDLEQSKNFPGIPQEKIYSELLIFYFWVLGFMKIPFGVRGRIIELSFDAKEFSPEQRRIQLGFIGTKRAEYSEIWDYEDGSREATRRAARMLLCNIDPRQNEDPLSEMNQVYLEATIMQMIANVGRTSVYIHENAKLVGPGA